MKIGEYIRSKRTSSLSDCAYNCYISASFLSDIEKGNRSCSVEVLDRIIMVLGLDRTYAYYLTGRYVPEMLGMDQGEYMTRIGRQMDEAVKKVHRETNGL